MSDTGGGHRAACRAIMAGLDRHHSGQYTTELVDMWADYTPYPFRDMPRNYTRWINTHAASYEAQFWILDRLFRLDPASAVLRRVFLPFMRRFYREHPADIYVCAHSIFTRPAAYARDVLNIGKPFITVITDWALPTVLWYDRRADSTLVPTQPAYERGLQLGLSPDRMQLTGAVVHPKYADVSLSKAQARSALDLGFTPTERIVLLIGGGDGMGPLVETARQIDSRRLDYQLIILCGKNAALKAELDTIRWHGKVQTLGFRDDLHILMRASDVLITKAGPATITEAAIIGLPLIISGAIKYQESPNTEYAVAQGAGIYAPGARKTANVLSNLLNGDPAVLEQMSRDIQRLAAPDAIWKIADTVWSMGSGT